MERLQGRTARKVEMKRIIIRNDEDEIMIDIKQGKGYYPIEYLEGIKGRLTIVCDDNSRIIMELGHGKTKSKRSF